MNQTYNQPGPQEFSKNVLMPGAPPTLNRRTSNGSNRMMPQIPSNMYSFAKRDGPGKGSHACEYCGRRCQSMSALENHVRIHTGE